MSKNIDLRILKTRQLIHTSFLELIVEKSFDKVTINEISSRAQINCSTFYLHYVDKYELLDKIINESVKKLIALIFPESHLKNGQLDFEAFNKDMQNILDAVAYDSLFYKAILINDENDSIKEKLINMLKKILYESFPKQTPIPKELFIEYITSLYISTITWWLKNDMLYTPTYMSKQLIKMLTMEPVKLTGMISLDNF